MKPGSVWINSSYLHFIDESGNEYRYIGNSGGTKSGAKPGSMWIENNNLCYIDANSVKRILPDYSSTVVSGLIGSVWVYSSAINWIKESGSKTYGHGDAHWDDAHGDEAHGDGHYDDGHGDDAHGDDAHGDDASHNDHDDIGSDHNDHDDVSHWDETGNGFHVDNPMAMSGNSHNDDHYDSSHNDDHWDDSHGDDAHGDDFHGDDYGHNDHTDTPHIDDAPYNDHTDNPSLV